MKPDINLLINNYQTQLRDIHNHIDSMLWIWDQRKDAVKHGLVPLETSNLHRVYENSLVEAVVAWQDFAARWVTYALVHDSSVLRQKIVAAERAPFDVSKKVRVQLPPLALAPHPTLAEVHRLLVDQRGFFSVNDQSAWGRYGGLMGPKFARLASNLKPDDHLVIELCRLLRNVSAHRSDESVRALKKLVTSTELENLDSKSGTGLPTLSRTDWHFGGEAGLLPRD